MQEVLETAQYVVNKSRHVRIDREALCRFCQNLIEQKVKIPAWNHRYHFYDGSSKTVAYLFILDSLNFCFWSEPRWEIHYQDENLSGYWALAASLKRAIENRVPITEAEYLAQTSPEELREIFKGKGEIPLWERRREILQEIGKVLKQKYNGRADLLVTQASKSAANLVRMLVADFSNFRDEAWYKNHKICFYKRAQIFVADLYGCFQGKSFGEFHDLEQLTAFADYKLPQVLRHRGILKYSPNLARKVDYYEPIPAGSPEEVEIRANTVWAVELIRQELKNLNLRAFEIDWILWDLGQKSKFKEKAHHRTLTIYY